MAIDDKLAKSEVYAEIVSEAQKSIPEMFGGATAATIAATLPYGTKALPLAIGALIVSGFAELSGKRIYDRMQRMWQAFSERLKEIGEKQIDREWFHSEEFQCLLLEVLSQLRSTEDAERIRLFGSALASGAATEFATETRKEIFVRVIKEISPQHIIVLKGLVPPPLPSEDVTQVQDIGALERWRWDRRPTLTAGGDRLLVLRMLAANGLVEEELRVSSRIPSFDSVTTEGELRRKVAELLKEIRKPPEAQFRLSELGRDFLLFVGIVKTDAKPSQ